MAETPAGYGWYYTTFGTTRHLLAAERRVAVCGQLPAWFCDWLGTGNQREYERCASLAACKRCVRRMPGAAEWQVST